MKEIDVFKEDKIKELEAEIEKLKQVICITEGDYKDNPILEFTGPFKPFKLGLQKCKAVLKSIDEIRSFVAKHDPQYLADNDYTESYSGEFCDECLPRTYHYFQENGLENKYSHISEVFDRFDLFILDRIQFLSYMTNQYYKKNRPYKLKLKNFAEDRFLDHLDELIDFYLRTNSKNYYDLAKKFYDLILETFILNAACNKLNKI